MHRADMEVGGNLGRPGLQRGEVCGELLQYRPQLAAGDVGTETEVRTVAEGEVLVGARVVSNR
jgi:hypothetical protein